MTTRTNNKQTANNNTLPQEQNIQTNKTTANTQNQSIIQIVNERHT